MKIKSLLLALFIPGLMIAQQPNKPVTMSVAPEKVKDKTDTTILKDPSAPGKEYWIISNPGGSVKTQGGMLNGKKDGTWREYGGANNALTKVEEYKDGKKYGMVTTLNFSGMVTTDETYRNDTLNGKKLQYSQSAKLKVIEFYRNGLLDGERTSFYDDGKVQEEGVYKQGKRQGLTKWYLQSGTLSMEYNYTDGILNGISKMYDEKGLIKQEGNFVNDNEEGEWKEYEGGVLTKKILYKGGTVVKETKVK
jgi:antitoxin component YwqK of YwqJK toxin-antitoxin module